MLREAHVGGRFLSGILLLTVLGCGGTDMPMSATPMPGEDLSDTQIDPPSRPGSPDPVLDPGVGPSERSDFAIQLRFETETSDSVRDVFERAAERWARVIVDDLEDIRLQRGDLPAGCGKDPAEPDLEVDDLLIFVRIEPIDQAGNVLGAAGPCVLRVSDGSPLVGAIRIDSADVELLQASERLAPVVLHEMGHVLGLGSLWDRAGLLRQPSVGSARSVDTHFVGPLTQQAFDAVGGDAYSGGETVPVENNGSPGSADGHWREAVFRNELMSPSLASSDASLPLSAVTVASLADFGFYVVDPEAADPYQLPTTVAVNSPPSLPLGAADRRLEPGAADRRTRDSHCVVHGPQMVAHRDGSMEWLPQ